MTRIMLCKHGRVKDKLVAWAISYRRIHRQGFIYKRCCVDCGKVVATNNTKKKDSSNERR